MANYKQEAAKNILKGLTQSTIFDPDLSADKDSEEVKPFTLKQIVNHATGRKKFTANELEQLNKQAKQSRFL